jgi:predicted RNA-binding protein (virulence factor B family)
MLQLGAFHTLEVVEEKPFGMLLGDGSVVLPRRNMPKGIVVGEQLRVFVYEAADGRIIAAARFPKGEVGDFAHLKVVDQSQHGAFLDWGLGKDLFVPQDEQASQMMVGKSYVVAITTDESGRAMGSSLIREFLDDDMSPVSVGRSVKLLAYEHHERGMKVIVDKRWDGMIFQDEIYRDLRVGSRLEGTVSRVRDDAKLDIHIRRHGSAGMAEGRDSLVVALEKASGFLALTDKSEPAAIKAELGMSKKAFKRAVGNLLRSGQITLEDGGIRLVPVESEPELC